ncbi:hypothetical protein H5072_18735 [Pseudoalteromonas sp. SR45-5]|nr:hypothetical protein [Pseudoalteromonas sp. SR45-5]
MEFLRFPIFIASISVPVSLVISRFHSSKLASKSNALNEKNIAFNHYFDLKRHFKEHVNRELVLLDKQKSIEVVDIDKLFEVIFPNNSWERTDLTSSIDNVVGKFGEWVESIEPNLMNTEISNATAAQYNKLARELGLLTLNGSFKRTPLQFNYQFVAIAWGDSESPLIHGIELLYDITIISAQFSKLPLAELTTRLTDRKDNIVEQVFVEENDAMDRFESMFSVLVKDYEDSLKDHV